MVRKKRRQLKMGVVGWAILALAFLGGWYWYQNNYAGQELEIYEASLPLAPKEIVQEWTFDNLATAWEPINFSRYVFRNGMLTGTVQQSSYLEMRAIKRGLTPASAIYGLRVWLSYQPPKDKKEDVRIQELRINEELSSKPSPSPVPTPTPRPSPVPQAFELSWEMLDERRQVVAKDSEIVTATTTLTEVYLELPQLPDIRSARTLRLYPAVNAFVGLSVTIDKIVLEEAKIIMPTPAPRVSVTGKLTKATLEGQTFYQLTDVKGKNYYLVAVQSEVNAAKTNTKIWDKYLNKRVTVVGTVYPVNESVVSFMPQYETILVSRIMPRSTSTPRTNR